VFADGSGHLVDVPVSAPFQRSATYKVFASSATGIASATFTIVGSLVPSTSSATPGQALTATGTGFTPGERVALLWDTAAQRVGEITAAEDGSFRADIRVPGNAGAGQHELVAAGVSSAVTLAHPLAVRWVASASVTPARAVSGDQITVAGSGFTPDAGFYIRWGGPDGPPIGSGMADGTGMLPATTATIPRVPAGAYTLYVTNDRDSTATVPFAVVALGAGGAVR
jgi:hypothetical protein